MKHHARTAETPMSSGDVVPSDEGIRVCERRGTTSP